jgi:hypothetical protein
VESDQYNQTVKEQILFTIAEIMQKAGERSNRLKTLFRDLGGLIAIVSILQVSIK